MTEVVKSIPMVPLRGMTVLPREVIHFDVSRKKSIQAIQEVMAGDQKIFLVAQKQIETEEVAKEEKSSDCKNAEKNSPCTCDRGRKSGFK